MNFSFVVPEDPKIQKEFYVTTPSGRVEKIGFSGEDIAPDGYLIAKKRISHTFAVREK
jgi:hypothetical protein